MFSRPVVHVRIADRDLISDRAFTLIFSATADFEIPHLCCGYHDPARCDLPLIHCTLFYLVCTILRPMKQKETYPWHHRLSGANHEAAIRLWTSNSYELAPGPGLALCHRGWCAIAFDSCS